ncbi:MAG: hypothetical protein GY878_06390 [Fuerstiella sp.]|nr:hypothetical protein [Fuerstiella sp.]
MKAYIFLIAVLTMSVAANSATAQTTRTVTVKGADGKPMVVEAAVSQSGTPPGKPAEKPPSSGAEKKKEDDKDKKPEDGKTKESDAASKVIKRPTTSDEPAKPIGTEAVMADGKVTFDLKGQPWDQVLQWLADTSELSLDWQELPGDTLNLTTTRSYTLEEARDIVNRHLLARGFGMVLNGELLSVITIGDIKSSLVPRVEPEELESQLDHTLCKVSFDLNWLIADEAVEELAPLLSSAGKISKLSRTNRLEVMDTARSLKDIYRILTDEQSDTGQEQLVRTFRLKERRASEVIELLRTLLGLENEGGGGSSGGSMGSSSQLTSMMRQMQQQMQKISSGAAKGGGSSKEPTKTRLVLNQRENMILVQAAPDQMAIIDKAIEQIDVPIETGNSLLQNVNRMKIYRLETVDPQTLVDLLQELGDMEPGTVLKVDDNKKSILAWASLADHLTITTLVERLDQSGRTFEVIPLRRLDAEYVTGTIRALMSPPPKEDNNSRSSYYNRYSYSQPEKKEDDRDFKVEADLENNRLLVYANKMEMDEIKGLLQKLGEIPDPAALDNGIRVFEKCLRMKIPTASWSD